MNGKHMNVRPFKCTVEGCERTFTTQRLMKCHQKYFHTSRRPLPKEARLQRCGQCLFQTKVERVLKAHITLKHSKEELTVKCEECSTMCRSKIHLRDHMWRVHKWKRKQLSCDWPGCDYTTNDGNDRMKGHKLSHIGNRDFKCDFDGCNMSFNTARILQKHRMTHEKPHVCSWPECDQRFARAAYLTAHMNKHLNLR